MIIKTILFGQLAEIAGTGLIELPDINTTFELVKDLNEKFPDLADSKYIIAVDGKVVSGDSPLKDNCTVALLPPFSGA